MPSSAEILAVQARQLFAIAPEDLLRSICADERITADGCLTLVAAMRAGDLRQWRTELKQDR